MTEFSPGNSYKQASFNTISNNEISLGRTDRTLPRQVSTGSTRGTQTVGYGNTKIDGTNNTITIQNPTTDVSISVGVISQSTGSGVGLSVNDRDGFLLFKMDGQTWYWYDKASKKNVLQVGLLPDGSYGIAAANTGFDVADGF